MTTISRCLALMATCLATSTLATVDMTVRYTDNMIDVGNLDAFAATWQVIYATDGNLQGVETDASYGTDRNTCQTDSDSDLTVRVTIHGSWGAEANVTQNDMRNAMVATMWISLEAIWAQNQYTVYADCAGLTWQESVAYASSAACGPRSAASCADACSLAASTPHGVQCTTATSASKLPSILTVTAYDGDTLLADELTVTFSSTANDVGDGGCGIVGTISEELASFVPVVGGLFSQGIAFACAGS